MQKIGLTEAKLFSQQKFYQSTRRENNSVQQLMISTRVHNKSKLKFVNEFMFCATEFTAPFNNMRNLKFISPPTVAFFVAVNHNLNICTSAINGPWKTETYKNNRMDRNPPITTKNVTFWPLVKGPWKTETFKMDRNPPITAKKVTFWPRWTHLSPFQRLPLLWLTAAKPQPLVVIWSSDSACYWKAQ